MVIRSPHLALRVMQDIAKMLNAKVYTLSNKTHVTYITIQDTTGNIAYWSHDTDDCEIVVNRSNRNVRQYLHNIQKHRSTR
jgi:hypothetical protein